MTNKQSLKISITAMLAAIISVSGFVKIPIGPVPVVLQNVVCLLCAVLTGGIFAATPVALFLTAGLLGLPVFSGGTSGLAVFAGPTGGFLIGYLLGAFTTGLIAGKPDITEKKVTPSLIIRLSLAMFLGLIVMYIPGIIHFSSWALRLSKVPEGKTVFSYAIGACILPFIPGDIIKCFIAVCVALKVRPVIASYLYSGNTDNDKNQ
ncbi:MAG: biotin transporter BioY [Treponema sp.]|nr:biotin transporter BioY [Treponema sp.]